MKQQFSTTVEMDPLKLMDLRAARTNQHASMITRGVIRLKHRANMQML